MGQKLGPAFDYGFLIESAADARAALQIDPALFAGAADDDALSGLALLTGRRELWATIIFAAAYASDNDDDPLSALREAAESEGPDAVSTNTRLGRYQRESNIALDLGELWASARVIKCAVTPIAVYQAVNYIGTIEACIRANNGADAVARCIRGR